MRSMIFFTVLTAVAGIGLPLASALAEDLHDAQMWLAPVKSLEIKETIEIPMGKDSVSRFLKVPDFKGNCTLRVEGGPKAFARKISEGRRFDFMKEPSVMTGAYLYLYFGDGKGTTISFQCENMDEHADLNPIRLKHLEQMWQSAIKFVPIPQLASQPVEAIRSQAIEDSTDSKAVTKEGDVETAKPMKAKLRAG